MFPVSPKRPHMQYCGVDHFVHHHVRAIPLSKVVHYPKSTPQHPTEVPSYWSVLRIQRTPMAPYYKPFAMLLGTVLWRVALGGWAAAYAAPGGMFVTTPC